MTDREAIDALQYMISGDCTDMQMDYTDEIELGISALTERMEREGATDINVSGKWISVKDRLPNEGANVLIDIPFRGCHINYVAYMESGLWYVPTMYGRSGLDDVTHWQPLPKPPKEDNNAL